MTMGAISCLVLSVWRVTADLGWTDPFAITAGMMSHWQVWLAITIALGYLAARLIRYGRIDQEADAPAAEQKTGESLPAGDRLKSRSAVASR